MGKQEQVQKQGSAPATQDQTIHANPQDAKPADLEATDALIDEIDEMLDDILGETSAQDFVNDYIQKGGE